MRHFCVLFTHTRQLTRPVVALRLHLTQIPNRLYRSWYRLLASDIGLFLP